MTSNYSAHNQRDVPRQKLIYYLKLGDTKTNLELARVGDINRNGLLLLSSTPLPLHTTYNVLMDLPRVLKTSNPKDNSLELHLETMWTKPGPKNTTYHETGTKLVGILNNNQAQIINHLIEMFAMPDS